MNGVYSSRVLLQNPDIAQQKDIHFYLDGAVSPPKKRRNSMLEQKKSAIDLDTKRDNLRITVDEGLPRLLNERTSSEVRSPKKTFNETVVMLK